MNKWLAKIAEMVYEYGRESAGMPSKHGAFEGEVPEALKNDNA